MTIEKKTDEAAESAEAALSAGYNKINPPADDKTPDKTPDEPPVVAQPSAKEADPWEGVSPIVRQTLEGINTRLGTVDTLSRDIKTTAGRVAAVQSALDTAKATAKTMDNAPSAAQIADAAKSQEKWKILKEDFPEWTDAMDERFAAERAEILKNMPKSEPVDVDGIRREVRAEAVKEARQLSRVDQKYENWEEDIRAPGFAAWVKTQAPEIQALANSDFANDAIKMLDLYYDHRKVADRKEKNQTRLAANVAPRSAAGSGPTILPDEAGLSVGYQRVKHA